MWLLRKWSYWHTEELSKRWPLSEVLEASVGLGLPPLCANIQAISNTHKYETGRGEMSQMKVFERILEKKDPITAQRHGSLQLDFHS